MTIREWINTRENEIMNRETAEAIVARLKGQPIWVRYTRNHETYRPRGCIGTPGKVICTDESAGDGEMVCDVRGWDVSVSRPVNLIVMPGGMTYARVTEAVALLDAASDDQE